MQCDLVTYITEFIVGAREEGQVFDRRTRSLSVGDASFDCRQLARQFVELM
jgi:hypothetical protein